MGTSFLGQQEVTGPVCPHSPVNRKVSAEWEPRVCKDKGVQGPRGQAETGGDRAGPFGGRQLDVAMET